MNWIPFLTTRLVDDAASHFRLFKQARLKFEQVNKARTLQNSPAREVGGAESRHLIHKRNKSEADISKFEEICG